MESIETRVKQLEVITDNLDERVQDLDVRTSANDSKIRQIFPVVLMYARRNVLGIISLGVALAALIMQIVNNK